MPELPPGFAPEFAELRAGDRVLHLHRAGDGHRWSFSHALSRVDPADE